MFKLKQQNRLELLNAKIQELSQQASNLKRLRDVEIDQAAERVRSLVRERLYNSGFPDHAKESIAQFIVENAEEVAVVCEGVYRIGRVE